MASLNHIGIATADLEGMKKLFRLLGLEVTYSESVAEQGVDTHFLPLPEAKDSHLELLAPSDPEGVVAQFIRKRGTGVHHLSFTVTHLDSLCDQLREEGYRMVYDRPRPSARNMRMNFIHPASAGGILIELMERG